MDESTFAGTANGDDVSLDAAQLASTLADDLCPRGILGLLNFHRGSVDDFDFRCLLLSSELVHALEKGRFRTSL